MSERRRVLVTGASGFVGRHCLGPLESRGFEVHAVSRRELDAGPGTWHVCDLLDEAARRSLVESVSPSHLLHAAWFLEPGVYLSSELNADWAAASIDLVRTFQRHGGKRVVALGTCFEYEFGRPVLGEDAPLRPASVYGATKKALWMALRALSSATELSFAWARLFFLFGPFEDRRRLVGDVASSLLEGCEVATSDGLQRRDYMFVEDAGDALAELVASDVEGEVNVATGEAPPVRQLVADVAAAAGRPELVRYGARPAPAGDPPEIRADVRRLTEDVGWRAYTPREEAIARTVRWWAEHVEVRA